MNPLSHWEREGPVDIVDGRVWGYSAGQSRMVTNGGEDAGERTDYLIIGEPQDGPAEALDLLLAMIVIQLPFVPLMNPAVQLDDELQGHAGEVGEIAIDGVLAAEAKAVEAAGAQILPEGRFSVGLALAEGAGAGSLSLGRHDA